MRVFKKTENRLKKKMCVVKSIAYGYQKLVKKRKITRAYCEN